MKKVKSVFEKFLKWFSKKNHDPSPHQRNDLFSKYSAKISRVFIELHNYSYFHGPSEVFRPDKRFIGRERLIETFKSILTNSEKLSGTYLVTGFRGMGKTSFVNKVLQEISGPPQYHRLVKRYIRIFLFCLFFYVVFLTNFPITGTILFCAIHISSYLYLEKKRWRPINKNPKNPERHSLFKKWKHYFQAAPASTDSEKLNTIILDLFIVSFLILTGFTGLFLFRIVRLYLNGESGITLSAFQQGYSFLWLLIPFLLLLSITLISHLRLTQIRQSNEIYPRKLDNETDNKKGFLAFIVEKLIYAAEKLYNYSEQRYIALNLGYTDLKEIDILRLIARKIQTEYTKFQHSYNTLNFGIRVFLLFCVFLLAGFLYKNPSYYHYNKMMKEDLSINYYLPSQIPILLESEGDLLEKLIPILNDKGRLNYNNLYYVLSLLNKAEPEIRDSKDDIVEKLRKSIIGMIDANRPDKLRGLLAQWDKEERSGINVPINDDSVDTLRKLCELGNSTSRVIHSRRMICELDSFDQNSYWKFAYRNMLEKRLVSIKNHLSVLYPVQEETERLIEWQGNEFFIRDTNLFRNKISILTKAYRTVHEEMSELTKICAKDFETADFHPFDIDFLGVKIKYDATIDKVDSALLHKYVNLVLFDQDLIDYFRANDIQKVALDSLAKLFQARKNIYHFISTVKSYRSLETSEIKDYVLSQDSSILFRDIDALLSHLFGNPDLRAILDQNSEWLLDLQTLHAYNQLYSFYKRVNDKKPASKIIASVTSPVDIFIYKVYYRLYKNLVPFRKLNNAKLLLSRSLHNTYNQRTRLQIIPMHLDYLQFIYWIITWYILKFLYHLVKLKNTTRRNINRRIKHLNEIIDSQVTIEKISGFQSSSLLLSFFNRKQRNYKIADEREIEKHLIEILEDISRLNRFDYRAQFVFIFDELDKIEPKDEFRGEYNDTKHQEKPSIFTPEGTRQRQHAVMSLLSNLKFFLSTARAKFIFIAGREMFDASLADVSDRNFNIGSIFHHVTYLNSFLTDLDVRGFSDITSRAEEYVCRFLIPDSWVPHHDAEFRYSLSEYKTYLSEEIPEFREDLSSSKVSERILAHQKIEKIIFILEHFITYLTHVSKGAPNKITSFFDKYILKDSKRNKINVDSLVAGKNLNSHYLFFDYYDQYNLSIINFIQTPINLFVNTDVRHHSDKLLVSASFLIDHLFKFHKSGFSYRNMESSPEIVDINKSSELRELVLNIISFLRRNHLQTIVNGLFDFKFANRISRELNLLSKVNEEASASYNFMLDESLAIKEFFREELKKLIQQHKDIQCKESKGQDYIYSISSTQLNLGDLYYYDEEFGAAISYYLDSIQCLRHKKLKDITLTQLVLLVRNMLKLGISLEKRKTYDTAFLTYQELTEKVIDFAKTRKNEYVTAAYEVIRLLVQPLFAKLQVIEKRSIDGITAIDLKRTFNEFMEMHDLIADKSLKYPFMVEFLNKIGDITFYSNGLLIGGEIDDLYTHEYPSDLQDTSAENYSHFEFCKDCSTRRKRANAEELHLPCTACYFYHRALKHYLDMVLANEKNFTKNIIPRLLEGFISNQFYNTNDLSLEVLANTLSDVGDCYYSCSDKTDTLDKEFLADYLAFIGDSNKKNTEALFKFFPQEYNNESPGRYMRILMLYRLSAIFYKKAGNHKNAVQQQIKILIFLREIVSVNSYLDGSPDHREELRESIEEYFRASPENSEAQSKSVENTLLRNILKSLYRSYSSVHFSE
ncbi:MAG: ATP-binding protein, partial [Bacteroidales bacterium]